MIEYILGSDINSFICDDPGLQDPQFDLTEDEEACKEEYNVHVWAEHFSPRTTKRELINIQPVVEADIETLGYSSSDLPWTGPPQAQRGMTGHARSMIDLLDIMSGCPNHGDCAAIPKVITSGVAS